MNLTELQAVIDLAWEARAEISAVNSPEVRDAVEHVIDELKAACAWPNAATSATGPSTSG